MPTYTINGKRVKTDRALNDDEIDEIASTINSQPPVAPKQPVAKSQPGLLQSALDAYTQAYKNAIGGAIRGAGSIGATWIRPFETAEENALRRQQIDEGLNALIGADPKSALYQFEKFGGEVAGTSGLGPLMASGARVVPVLARFAPALESGGLAPQMPRGVTNALTRIGAGGLTGGATTLAIDPSQTLEGAQIGAALGATAPVVTGLTSAATKVAEKLYRGAKNRALLEAAEGRGQDIVDILRGDVELVPGSMPTAGEAAAPLNLTRYSALQKTASENVPELVTPYFQRGQQQEAARLAAVRGVGKTPAELEAAKNLRGAEANKLYGLARQGLVQSDSTLAPLLDRPSMGKAFERAAKLAREAGDEFLIGKNVPEQVVPSSVVDQFGNPVGSVTIPAQFAEYPVKSLHYVKLALDDLLKNPAEFGIGATEAKMIGDTRRQFISWLEKNSPEYAAARTAFATASKPINQMEVGQYLEGKLTGGLGEERARVFGNAVKEAPTTIRSAVTGAPRMERLSEILTPEQLKAVEAVKADLERGLLFEQQARAAGRIGPTAERAATSASAETLGGAMPSLLSRIQTVANAIMKRLTTGMDRKLAIQIATEMLDPKAAAAAMEKALAREASIQGAKKVVSRTVGAVPKSAVAAATVNALRSPSNNAFAE